MTSLKFRSLIVLLTGLALLTSVCAVASGDDSTGAMSQRVKGWLHTKNGQILDSTNHPVQFRGIMYTRLAPGTGQPSSQSGSECTGWTAPTSTVFNNVKKWGFNVVRLSITWANIEPSRPFTAGPFDFHDWNDQYLTAVDNTVKGFTSRGVAVILELSQNKWSPYFERHQGSTCPGRGMPMWLYKNTTTNSIVEAKKEFFGENKNTDQEQYADVWKLLAQRYANNSMVVAADIFNEPYLNPQRMSSQEMNLTGFYQKVGGAIRSVNPRLLLLIEDNQVLGPNKSAMTKPPRFSNLVYEFHLYAHKWDSEGQDWADGKSNQARTWKLPVFMGEFNAFGYGSNTSYSRPGKRWQRDTKALMAYAKAHGIAWTFAAYSGGNSLVQPGSDDPKPDLLPILQGGY
jgi:hypothetical protein